MEDLPFVFIPDIYMDVCITNDLDCYKWKTNAYFDKLTVSLTN